jgi:DNA-binding response OmpR family regulator
MTTVLFVADRQSVIDRVSAALSGPDMEVIHIDDPDSAAAAAYDHGVDRVLVDMKVGSMGAMAVARAVRAKAGDGDAAIPVTVLLDREADAFLAGRSGAENWLTKDATAAELRKAVTAS